MTDQYDEHADTMWPMMQNAKNEAERETMAAYMREHFIEKPPAPEPVPDAGFAALPLDKMERIIHLSSASHASDVHAGASELTAVRTVGAAKAQVREGHHDCILIEAGSGILEPIGRWTWSGFDGVPTLLGVYGDGPRPVIHANANGLITNGGGGTPDRVDDLWIIGLEFRGHGDHDGIGLRQPGARLLIEDCVVSGYDNGVVIEGWEDKGVYFTDLAVRRCIIRDNASGDGKSQGLFAAMAVGLEIIECAFHRNGWSADADATKYSHNIYIAHGNKGVYVARNLISAGASHGAQLRSGGAFRNNLLLDNAIGLLMGGDSAEPGGTFAEVGDVVIAGGRMLTPTEARGWGIDFGSIAAASVDGLAILHAQPNAGHALGIKASQGIAGAGNFLHKWGDGEIRDPDGVLPADFWATPGPNADLDRVQVVGIDAMLNRARGVWHVGESPAEHVAWILEGLRA